MKAPAPITTPTQYLAHLPPERRAAIRTVHEAIRAAVPELKPAIGFGMLGYGPFRYR